LSLRGYSVVPSRPWRLVAVLVAVFAFTTTTTTPAFAEAVDCVIVKGIRPIECGPAMTSADEDYQKAHLDAEWWRPMVALYFDPGDVDRAICLMEKESGGDPNARNPSTDAAGLMQVMPFWAKIHGYTYDELFNPGINLWVASRIRDQQGWLAWSPYLRGVCRQGLRGSNRIHPTFV